MKGIPEKYTKLIGTKQKFLGCLFSINKSIEETEFDILDVRWGSGMIINFKQLQETGKSDYRHPTINYLVKNKSMKRSRWTQGFAVREINLEDQD